MLIKMGNSAVSEIVGAIFLLAIAISVFSVIYMNVLSDDGPEPVAYVTIVGKIETGDLVFEHHSGETLDLDSNVILTIAGQRQDPKTLAQLLDLPSQQDGVWNIGERVVWSLQSFGIGPEENVRVDAEIYDKSSNSMVFWGMLQDGYTVPPFGRGGIWHFDEPDGWDDNKYTTEVLDSSGNGNHGSAVGGANNIDLTAVSGKAGFFDGVDDYVEVPSKYSLNITQALTVEAWVRPLEERTEIDTKDFGEAFAFNPEILNVKDDLFVVVGEGQLTQTGMVVTVNITSDGEVSEPFDTSFFDSFWGVQPSIIKVSSNDDYAIFAIVYIGKVAGNNVGKLQTIKIYFNNGSIFSGTDAIDEWTFDSTEANLPYIIKASDNVFAIAYRDSSNKGLIKTIELDEDGFIDKVTAPIATYTFNDTAAYGSSIIKVSNYTYAIVYRNSNNLGLLQTINITLDGHINSDPKINPINETYFGKVSTKKETPGAEQRIKIINVTDEYYAIIYSDDNDIGNIITVRISSNGTISEEGSNVFSFSTDSPHDYCMAPDIVQVHNNTYAITYAQKGDLGSVVTIQIEPDGSIDSLETLSNDVSSGLKFFSPEIIHIHKRVFVVVYMSGTPHEGMLTTILTEDITSIYQRGVVRAGAASVYAQWKKGATVVDILACINTSANDGEVITTQVTPNEWHYIVLTFNGSQSQMCLYNDASLIDCKSVGPSIYIPKSDLKFGNSYYGYLDEIAIFDYAFSSQEIQDRFNSVINTKINPITSPVTSPSLTVTATSASPTLDDVTLWYRWRNEARDPIDSNTCDYDSSEDKGTETNFANVQDISPDDNVMAIQEAGYGTPAVNDNHYVDGFTNYINEWVCTAGGSPWLDADGDGKTISETKGGDAIGWFTFTDTTATGFSTYSISLHVYATSGDGDDDVIVYIDTTGDNSPEFNTIITNPTNGWFDTGPISGLTTVEQFNAARVWFEYLKDPPGNTITLDAAYLRITSPSDPDCYNIDFEYQWSAANYDMANAEVCIYVDSHTGAEDLLVKYWTGSAWSTLDIITGTGWFNFTATGLTSTYTIQLIGAKESSDTIQDIWDIDVIMLRTWDTYTGWTLWSDADNPDTASPWSWNFDFPDGSGYYEFYSIGRGGSIIEPVPLYADASCLYIE